MDSLNSKLEMPLFVKEIHLQIKEKLGKLIVLKIFIFIIFNLSLKCFGK
jgi:hypothetical protein